MPYPREEPSPSPPKKPAARQDEDPAWSPWQMLPNLMQQIAAPQGRLPKLPTPSPLLEALLEQRPSSKPLEPSDVVVGGQVEYFSDSHNCWVPSVVSFVDAETGGLKLDIKPDHIFDLTEQRSKLRRRTRPCREHLEWVRRTLREGRIEEEAMAVFERHCIITDLFLEVGHMGPAGDELDKLLGVSGSYCALRKAADQLGGNGLSAEAFCEFFWELLWIVQRDYGHALPVATSKRNRGHIQSAFQIGETLGSGSFGVVKLATNRVTNQEVAVKLIDKYQHRIPEKELQMEIERLCALDHPHIVQLYECYEDNGNIYLVMDYCAGGELRSVVKEHRNSRRAIPEAFISQVMRQVMMAIAHVHARGIVHLDIKSTNIMLMTNKNASVSGRSSVMEKPHAVVIDLGVAQVFRPGNFKFNQPTGTPMTMAPEVWKGEIHPKADIFSLGVVLFELLSLNFPFTAGVDHAKAVKYWAARPTPPWEQIQTQSSIAKELCQRMLTLDRNGRPTAANCLKSPFLQDTSDTASPDPRLVKQLARAGERSVLHRKVALSLAREWPANQLPNVEHFFVKMDIGGSGCLTHNQLTNAMMHLGLGKLKAQGVAEAMDLSSTGTVYWTEFVAACIDLGGAACEPYLKRVFDKADEDNDGLLSQKDISQLLDADDNAARDVLVELTGREGPGARVDWPVFRKHFQTEDEGAGLDSLMPVTAQASSSSEKQAPSDFLEQAQSFMENAKEAFFPKSKPELGAPREDDLRELAQMGFKDRAKCIAALRKFHNRFSVLVVHELVETS